MSETLTQDYECFVQRGGWASTVCVRCRAVGWACTVYCVQGRGRGLCCVLCAGPWDGPVLYTMKGLGMDLNCGLCLAVGWTCTVYCLLGCGMGLYCILYSVYGGLYIGPRACRDLEIMPLSPYILYI